MKRSSNTRAHTISETKHLEALCETHRYVLADSLRSDQRASTIYENKHGHIRLLPAVCIKLIIPETSALGKLIIKRRIERDPATSAAAKRRARARAKTKDRP